MSPIPQALELSLWVAGLCTLITVPLGLLWATILFGSRWRPLEALFLLPLFLPPTVTGFAILWLLSPLNFFGAALRQAGLEVVFTFYGTLLACIVVSFPLAFQSCMVGLARVRPELLESGITLGGTGLLNTAKIVWPQVKGAVLIAALFVFARSLGEFGASMMVGGNVEGATQTLPLAVYSLAQAGKLSQAGVASMVSAGLGILVYIFLRVLESKVGR